MTEPLGTNDILSIMKEYGITQSDISRRMKLSRQAIHGALIDKNLSKNADYRFRLLVTYILYEYVGDTE